MKIIIFVTMSTKNLPQKRLFSQTNPKPPLKLKPGWMELMSGLIAALVFT